MEISGKDFFVRKGLIVNGTTKLQQSKEKITIVAAGATGTINFNALRKLYVYTQSATGNWTVNVRGSSAATLNSMMAIGESLTVVFLVTQGGSAYINNVFQIDGSTVTPKWQGGSAPEYGTANGIDAHTYTIIKTANATFTVMAAVSAFG